VLETGHGARSVLDVLVVIPDGDKTPKPVSNQQSQLVILLHQVAIPSVKLDHPEGVPHISSPPSPSPNIGFTLFLWKDSV
jgi:hypothetical protein